MERYSILQDKQDFKNRKCYICGSRLLPNIHEVYYGSSRRELSIKYGCCVCLCSYHHNGSNNSVHHNRELDLKLKQEMQKAFEREYPEIDFRAVFRKSYI